jgi:anthranilate synthase
MGCSPERRLSLATAELVGNIATRGCKNHALAPFSRQPSGERRSRGATALHDSDPHQEEAETRLKAAAMFAAIYGRSKASLPAAARAPMTREVRMLLVDHEDSFVHTLGGYSRAAGANAVTLRPQFARQTLAGNERVDIVLLSPGPGRADDFAMNETLTLATAKG